MSVYVGNRPGSGDELDRVLLTFPRELKHLFVLETQSCSAVIAHSCVMAGMFLLVKNDPREFQVTNQGKWHSTKNFSFKCKWLVSSFLQFPVDDRTFGIEPGGVNEVWPSFTWGRSTWLQLSLIRDELIIAPKGYNKAIISQLLGDFTSGQFYRRRCRPIAGEVAGGRWQFLLQLIYSILVTLFKHSS